MMRHKSHKKLGRRKKFKFKNNWIVSKVNINSTITLNNCKYEQSKMQHMYDYYSSYMFTTKQILSKFYVKNFNQLLGMWL